MNFIKLTLSLILAGTLLAGYGLLTRSASEPEVAAQSFTSVTGLDPVNGLAPLDEVVELFQRRSDERPSDYLSRTQLGQALNAQARETADLEVYEQAEVAFSSALEINPRWAPAQLGMARSLHSQHRFDEALQLATHVLDADPTSLSAIATAGDASLEIGSLEVAEYHYDQLASVERSAPVVSRLARLALVSGDLTTAAELAQDALMLSDELALRPAARAFYWFQLGRMQFEMGATNEAVTSYEQARELDPGNPAATEALAFTVAAQGKHGQAVDLYRELLEDSQAPDLYGSLADSLVVLGFDTEAAEQREIGRQLAVDTADQFPAERRHLVGFFQGIDAARAVELAQADLATRQDWAAYDTLAWALHHTGDDQAAAAVYGKAPGGDPPTAAMLYHQAQVFARVGDTDEAYRLVVKALAINANFHPVEADEAQALVDTLSR